MTDIKRNTCKVFVDDVKIGEVREWKRSKPRKGIKGEPIGISIIDEMDCMPGINYSTEPATITFKIKPKSIFKRILEFCKNILNNRRY